MAAAVETKVQASTAAAAVSGLALWSLGHWVFKAGVPDVVASWTYVIIPAAITFAAGYLAKHSPRPDLVPPVLTPVAGTAWPPKTLITPAAPESDQPGAAGPPAGSTP